jgi:hypothetical protein
MRDKLIFCAMATPSSTSPRTAIMLLSFAVFAIAIIAAAATMATTTASATTLTSYTNQSSSSSSFEDQVITLERSDSLSSSSNNNLTFSHRWSEITLVPAGASKIVRVFCESGSYPLAGGFSLGSRDLQVTGSYSLFSQNGSMGWAVSVLNTNTEMQLPAAADVLCRNVTATTTADNNTLSNATTGPEGEEEEGLTVRIDSQSYSIGDTIQITGTVGERRPDAEVLVSIINPDSDEIVFTSVPVAANNTFGLSFEASNDGIEDIDANIGSGEMEVSGQYLVTVTYLGGNDYETAGTTFAFDAEEEEE